MLLCKMLDAALKPHINNQNSWQLVLFQVVMAVQLWRIKTGGYIKTLKALKVWVPCFLSNMASPFLVDPI